MIPQLTSAYQLLNKELFEDQLPLPEFNSDPNRKGFLGFTSPATISFCKDFPAAKTAHDVLDDLVHQMIHIEHHQRGIEDHTSNQYHKKEFCARALAVGFYVSYNSSRGWAITTSTCPKVGKPRKPEEKASQKLRTLISALGCGLEELKDFQKQLQGEFEGRQSKQYQLKYICQCDPPHNTIRSGRRPDGQRPLDATCNSCGAKFVLEIV